MSQYEPQISEVGKFVGTVMSYRAGTGPTESVTDSIYSVKQNIRNQTVFDGKSSIAMPTPEKYASEFVVCDRDL